jgi:hypothetical protein
MFALLSGLLSSGSAIKSLSQILRELLGGGDVKEAAQTMLRKRLDAQAGRSAGKVLGRAVCEAVDQVLESPGLTIEQRETIAQALATNASLQTAEAAELVLGYVQYQVAVVKAKQGGDAAALEAARAERNAAAEAIKQAYTDIGRCAAGSPPQDV